MQVKKCFWLIAFTFIASAGEARASCKSTLLQLNIHSTQEFRTWLKKNLLLGPEVAISSDIIDTIPNAVKLIGSGSRSIQSHKKWDITHYSQNQLVELLLTRKNYLSRTQAKELVRLVHEISNIRRIHLHRNAPNLEIQTPEGAKYQVHTCNSIFCFEIELKDQSTMTVNIEDGAAEINRPPILMADRAKYWKSLMNRLNRAGFYDSPHFASGGGGGHIHLGFKNANEHLFISNPQILSGLIAFFLKHPGIIFGLKELADYDYDSTSNLYIQDEDYREGIIYTLNKMAEFHKQKHFIKPNKECKEERLCALKSVIGLLSNHDSFVSLKNYFVHRNPTTEIRFPRTIKTFEDLEALTDFLFELIVYIYEHPPKKNLKERELYLPQDHPTPILEADFDLVLDALSLDESTKIRLKNFNGDNVFQEKSVINRTNHPYFENVKVTEAPPKPNYFTRYSLKLPKSFLESEAQFISIDGVLSRAVVFKDNLYVTLPSRPATDFVWIIHLFFKGQSGLFPLTFRARLIADKDSPYEHKVELFMGKTKWFGSDKVLNDYFKTPFVAKNSAQAYIEHFGVLSVSKEAAAQLYYKHLRAQQNPLEVIFYDHHLEDELFDSIEYVEVEGVKSTSIEKVSYYAEHHLFIYSKDFHEILDRNPDALIQFKSAQGRILKQILAYERPN